MGRFFRTSKVQGIDFVDEGNAQYAQDVLLKISDRKEKNLDEMSKLLDILPIDSTDASKGKLESINQNYNSEIDNITKDLVSGKISNSEASKRIREQQRSLKTSMQTGELKAINDNASEYKENVASIKEQFKNAPHVMQYRLKQLKENSGKVKYDKDLGTYTPLEKPEMYKHYTGKEISDALDTALKNVKGGFKEFLPESVKSIDDVHKLYRRGQIDEIKYKDIVESVANQLPEDIFNSVQQESDSKYKGIDESQIFNEDGSINRNTTLGRMIHGKAKAGQTIKVSDKSQVLRKPTSTGSRVDKSIPKALRDLNPVDRERGALKLIQQESINATKEYLSSNETVPYREPYLVTSEMTSLTNGITDIKFLNTAKDDNERDAALAYGKKDYVYDPVLYEITYTETDAEGNVTGTRKEKLRASDNVIVRSVDGKTKGEVNIQEILSSGLAQGYLKKVK